MSQAGSAPRTAFADLPGHVRAAFSILRADGPAPALVSEIGGLDETGRRALAGFLTARGLGGWAWSVLRPAADAVPADLARTLAQEHRRTTAEAILFLDAWRRVSNALTDGGVLHAPMKGIHLLEMLYPDPGARSLSDIDLLVPASEIERTEAVLRARGWSAPQPAEHRRERRFHHHLSFRSTGPIPMLVEVHWAFSPAFAVDHPTVAFWRAATPPRGARPGTLERVLGPVDLVHGLLLHVAGHGLFVSLKSLLDLRLLFARGVGVPSPDALVERAVVSRSVAACAWTAALAVEGLGAEEARPYRDALFARLPAWRRVVIERFARREMKAQGGDRTSGAPPPWVAVPALADDLRGAARILGNTVLYKSDLEATRLAARFRDRTREGQT